ncbi:NUDIX hydrolase [Rothia sp. P13129]|uniref:NUDIX hydrolase n=1 Tax=unclassified Rothia (in: high G+C Gram-positive bacteria) TaxID=2689056 RepID=UPI003AC62062
MSNQTLYTGALKVVRERTTETPNISRSPERLFKLPDEYASAAQAWLDDRQHTPCQPKTAASVVFVRDGKEGLETILTLRSEHSPLGDLAFPGGLCIPSDQDPLAWIGPDIKTWSTAFKQEDPVATQAAVVGAIRESFEETGMLLAGRDELSTVETSSEALDLMSAREAISQCDQSFADYLTKRGLTLRTDLLRPIARWQSPDFRHKRYDTHYFASVAPVGQHPKLLASKGLWGDWVNVRELLEHQETTVLGDTIGHERTRGKTLQQLIVPATLCILEDLAAVNTSVAYLAKKREVLPKKAEVVEQDGEYFLKYTLPQKPKNRQKCSL